MSTPQPTPHGSPRSRSPVLPLQVTPPPTPDLTPEVSEVNEPPAPPIVYYQPQQESADDLDITPEPISKWYIF